MVKYWKRRWDEWPRGLRWLIGGIAAVVLGLAIAWVLFVPAADWLAHHDVGPAKGPLLQTARDAARGRLLTLGAGLFAVGALVYTARNFTLSREGQVTDRYTKAIEQLGSPDRLDARIGGIYALERIARDSAKDHPTVMAVLIAFIREHSSDQWPPLPAVPPPGFVPPDHTTRPDVQAAVTVIGRRNPRHDSQQLDLTGVNLAGADLYGADLSGANLAGANFAGADLSFAHLTQVPVKFRLGSSYSIVEVSTAARLYKTDLTDANLTFAHLDDANLNGAILVRANLYHADLTGTTPGLADLTDAELEGATWPENETVPQGWERTPQGQLRKPETPTQANP